MSAWAELQVVARNIPCSYCGAAAGERCVSKFGRSASNIHRARFAPVLSAFSIGYGLDDVGDDFVLPTHGGERR